MGYTFKGNIFPFSIMGYTFKGNISSNFVQSVVVTLIIWALLWYGPHVSDTIAHYTKLGESFLLLRFMHRIESKN